MYKSILVPVDMSEDGFADKAIAHAKGVLAKGGKLYFLRVLPGYQMPWVGSFFPDGAFEKAMKEEEKKLEKYIAKQLDDKTVWVSTTTVEGKPADLILKRARKLKVDLIVMASHKHSRVERTIIGSVASKVVGRSSVPVLVVKNA